MNRLTVPVLMTVLALMIAGGPLRAADTDPEPPVTPLAVTNQKGNTYYLHSTETTSKDGKVRSFYFSTKTVPAKKGSPVAAVPEGYEVSETKNGLPVLKKAKAEKK
ncbi:MAG: hypothetical protein ACI9TH_004149 [Kiritimatiellia bacterium]|jgi:hypothetical protein